MDINMNWALLCNWQPVFDKANEGGDTGDSALSGADDNSDKSALSGADADKSDDKDEGGDQGSTDGDKTKDGDDPDKDGDKSDKDGEGDDTPEPLTAESITFPEGIEADAETLTPFLEIMNDDKLTRVELAQKIVDLQIKTLTEGTEAANEAAQTLWNDTQTQWQDEMKALPNIGGDNLDKSLATIKTGLIKAGADDAFFNALNVTGAGNHPEIVKVLFNLTKTRTEGGPVSGDPARGKLTQAEKMFGGHK